MLEFRQDQLKLQQLYTQIRIQVINAQYALTNDRAAVQAATATREYNTQALDAEKKKFKYGASTTALVLQQERSLAAAENTVTSAMATYAKDRASLEQILANTLHEVQHQHRRWRLRHGNPAGHDSGPGGRRQRVRRRTLPSQQQQLHTPPVAAAGAACRQQQQPQQQQAAAAVAEGTQSSSQVVSKVGCRCMSI